MDTVPVRQQIGHTLQKSGELWKLQIRHFIAEFAAAKSGLALGAGLMVVAVVLMLLVLFLAAACGVVALLQADFSLLQSLGIITVTVLIMGVLAGLMAWTLIQSGVKRFAMPFQELKINLECIRDQLMLISGINSHEATSPRES
ncbi:MAG: phage holin family protein [Pirellulales bacterium]|nr:phage holin family protein [Pirellulales bacterium]